ncbi:MAG: hypothetical protein WC449_05265 [Candidatus Paceibacterota bacterium]
MTNKEYMQTSGGFQSDCRSVNLMPTVRQASKYRRGLGIVYKLCVVGKFKDGSTIPKVIANLPKERKIS